MKIADPKMAEKMQRALKQGDALFTLDDVGEHLQNGRMQAHTFGETLVITQVHQWPRRKAVHIMYIVGDKVDMTELEKKVSEWARSIGADLLTATAGREGWERETTPGWRKVATLYSKDL